MSQKLPEYLLKKKKYKRGEAHTHPDIKDFDKEIPKHPTIHDGAFTITDNFYKSVTMFPNRPCMKYRPIKEVKLEDIFVEGEVKKWEVTYFNKTVTFTYQQVWDMCCFVGDALQKLCGLKKGSRICIFEDTRYEWFLIAHGAWRNGFVITTAYANLGMKNLLYCLNKTKCPVMVLNQKEIPAMLEHEKECPHLKYLFYIDETDKKEEYEKNKRFFIRPFTYLLEYGKENKLDEKELPKCGPDDYCVLMFTSGSTGVPKAVMVKQNNFNSAMFAAKRQLGFREETVFLAYLPLAHILELEAENCVLAAGGVLCFADKRTLIRDSHPHGDIKEYAPTVMLGVPRVWDTVKKRSYEIMTKKGGNLAKWVFKHGYSAKKKALYKREKAWFWNFVLFNSMKKKFGGRLVMLASGAAPLSASSHEFMAALMDVPFPQGYGLTEVCGAATGQDLNEFSTGNVGYPISTAMIKLVSVPEMGYNIDNEPREQGEICIHGPIVTDGYYEEPEKTKESFVKHDDGRIWFHSGDIGEWREDNQLSVIDRKKNLIKLSMGEYVAVLSLEADYMGDCPFVAPNGIFVHADPSRDRLVCVVQPMKSYLLEWARKHKKTPKLEELVRDADVNKAVLDSLTRVAKSKKYKKFQYVRAVELVLDEWTPENGLMTATFKLRRKPCTDKYKDLLEILFERAGAEVDKEKVAELKKQREEMLKKRAEAKKKEEVEGETSEEEEEIKDEKKSLEDNVKKKSEEEAEGESEEEEEEVKKKEIVEEEKEEKKESDKSEEEKEEEKEEEIEMKKDDKDETEEVKKEEKEEEVEKSSEEEKVDKKKEEEDEENSSEEEKEIKKKESEEEEDEELNQEDGDVEDGDTRV